MSERLTVNPEYHDRLGKVYEEQLPRLIRVCENGLRNKDVLNYETVAPDLVQRVFEQILRNGTELPQPKSDLIQFLNWQVQRQVENYSAFRAKVPSHLGQPYKIRDEHLVSMDSDLPAGEDRYPEDLLRAISTYPQKNEAVDFRGRFATIINEAKTLTAKQRNVLMEHFINSKSIQEIADIQGVHRNSVNQVKNNGLENLEDDLEFKQLIKELQEQRN